jgi:hypothetical protein
LEDFHRRLQLPADMCVGGGESKEDRLVFTFKLIAYLCSGGGEGKEAQYKLQQSILMVNLTLGAIANYINKLIEQIILTNHCPDHPHARRAVNGVAT